MFSVPRTVNGGIHTHWTDGPSRSNPTLDKTAASSLPNQWLTEDGLSRGSKKIQLKASSETGALGSSSIAK
jgi:hypothetical protein